MFPLCDSVLCIARYIFMKFKQYIGPQKEFVLYSYQKCGLSLKICACIN